MNHIKAGILRKGWTIRHWIRLLFILWATFAFTWLANSVRTRGVDEGLLLGNKDITVMKESTHLSFLPAPSKSNTALIFICGSGVTAEAYAPLLRPVADKGTPVFIIKLPYRFAPLASHKQTAMERVNAVIATYPEITDWVIAGHSLGGALAARMASLEPEKFSALLLIATTHPKREDLSSLDLPITKVYGSKDGVAPVARVLENKKLLPGHTRWIEVSGANHSQFGRYGHQLMDGEATISREQQEQLTREEIFRVLEEVQQQEHSI